MQDSVLYVVATPIGNLADISFRAVEVLKNVDLILAEDTRHTKILLEHYGISKQLLSLHAHNEKSRVYATTEALSRGSVALVSDAGTPAVCDPGAVIVQAVRKAGYKIVPIPGPCAITCALSAAGVLQPGFYFEGFLPSKQSQRQDTLKALSMQEKTIVFYESPHRILDTLGDIDNIFEKNSKVILAKELTKKYESIVSGTVNEIIEWFAQQDKRAKGEFVVIIEVSNPKKDHNTNHLREVMDILQTKLSTRDAIEIAESITGASKNLLYTISKSPDIG